ncbi:hypothetical protein [Pseudoflavonifractor sp. MCC625]|uniref:hypothetical protein n=1 Tax=Pseudoflavonifractor sp. MCC625 TaxID=2592647 RepID=UPI001C00B633|nr:hypothetical protein [Pseudoflavonifractor sp. MCC625]MBT9683580.1 hypothetical protein [Pseudoflavonifractor sp. MCC625]
MKGNGWSKWCLPLALAAGILLGAVLFPGRAKWEQMEGSLRAKFHQELRYAAFSGGQLTEDMSPVERVELLRDTQRHVQALLLFWELTPSPPYETLKHTEERKLSKEEFGTVTAFLWNYNLLLDRVLEAEEPEAKLEALAMEGANALGASVDPGGTAHIDWLYDAVMEEKLAVRLEQGLSE